ncbi:Fic family protein [Burkholderia gladioli]|uniref:Fic family protein n=1 Tax=Burkholderia gladioli TaxID=28095 RepID=UPI002FE21228
MNRIVTEKDSDLFNALGFDWDRSVLPKYVPVHKISHACTRLQSMLATYVFDASFLEGNPFSYAAVQCVVVGQTIPHVHYEISDREQVRNLVVGTNKLIGLVQTGTFVLDKRTFTDLQGIVAKEEALEWGNFRGEGQEQHYTPHVNLGMEQDYVPSATLPGAPNLNDIFSNGVAELEKLPDPFERAAAFFLFGALQQFFFDGNKRTSRMMMNGVLMSHGMDAISIPAFRAQEFNQKMVDFYVSRNATAMMEFLVDCHPDAKLLKSATSSTLNSMDSI